MKSDCNLVRWDCRMDLCVNSLEKLWDCKRGRLDCSLARLDCTTERLNYSSVRLDCMMDL